MVSSTNDNDDDDDGNGSGLKRLKLVIGEKTNELFTFDDCRSGMSMAHSQVK